MRLRLSVGLTVTAAIAVLGLPGPALAAPAATVLLVNNADDSHCSDSGTGTVAQPYCTVSAAAKVVQPGQTVKVAATNRPYLNDEVRLTRSGTPEQPITFLGAPMAYDWSEQPSLASDDGTTSSFVLSGVHDVVIRGFHNAGRQNAIVINDSSRITVDQSRFEESHGTADIRISGTSDHVTVSRSLFYFGIGVALDPGTHDNLVTANDFNRTSASAVTAKDSPGLALTNNTIAYSCQESVLIDGASPGAVVKNNVITADNPVRTQYDPPQCDAAHRGEAEISVSAGSTTGTTVDYNTVHPWPDAAGYRWAGTAYPTAAAFKAATGQAGHDADLNVNLDQNANGPFDRLADSDVAAIDSADPTAPGVGTDFFGSAPVDHPNVANTAPSGGVRDRGAYERTGLRDAAVSLTGATTPSPVGPAPLTVKATATATKEWGTPLTGYSFDFGDGSDPVVTTSPEASHTYQSTGSFRVQVTVTDASGARANSYSRIASVKPSGELTADFTTRQTGSGQVVLTPTASSPWAIKTRQVDFSDGRGLLDGLWPDGNWYAQFSVPGTTTVRLIVTDEAGHSVTVTKQVQVTFDTEHQVVLPGERVQLLGRNTDGLFSTGANYTRGLWAGVTGLTKSNMGGPIPPADQITSLASATGDNWLRVFAVGNGKIYSADRNLGPYGPGGMGYAIPGAWSMWSDFAVTSGPTDLPGLTQISASRINGKTHVVALAGGRVYESSNSQAVYNGAWSPWGDITAAAGIPAGTTQITAVGTGNSLHVAALGPDGHIRVADGNYDRGTWSAGDVTAVRGGPAPITQLTGVGIGNQFHIVALAGGNVHEITGDYAAGYWTTWGNISAATGLGGAVTKVTAATTGNNMRLFAVSAGHIHSTLGDYGKGYWTGWTDITQPGIVGTTTPVDLLTAAGTTG
ncbi:PKD domain-containing protein [Kitasatospora sp. NPDC057015]|uniref:PKD domain-containing protein n=1 Tax=Kitasatospora sp. NPDC057015 TaxID=3346001 RepID=UPI00363FC61D